MVDLEVSMVYDWSLVEPKPKPWSLRFYSFGFDSYQTQFRIWLRLETKPKLQNKIIYRLKKNPWLVDNNNNIKENILATWNTWIHESLLNHSLKSMDL